MFFFTHRFLLTLTFVVGIGLCLSPRSSMGQIDTNIGMRAGLTSTTLRAPFSDDVSIGNAGRRMGFAAGAFIRIGFQGPFALQPELLYVQKGTSDDFLFGERQATRTRRFDYIEIPVLAKYELPIEGPSFRPNIQAGPTLGINIVSRDELDKKGEPTMVFDANTRRLTVGFAVGTGVDFSMNGRSVSLDTRYSFDLTRTFEDSAEPAKDNPFRNHGVVLTLGFAF